MIRWLKRWYRNQKRMIDRETLWDHLHDFAKDADTARRAFRIHMDLDHSTYGSMTEREKQAYVELLEWRR